MCERCGIKPNSKLIRNLLCHLCLTDSRLSHDIDRVLLAGGQQITSIFVLSQINTHIILYFLFRIMNAITVFFHLFVPPFSPSQRYNLVTQPGISLSSSYSSCASYKYLSSTKNVS